MTTTRIADEYAYIAQRLAEIEAEKTAALNAEMPKVQPSYNAMYDGIYQSDDWDPA